MFHFEAGEIDTLLRKRRKLTPLIMFTLAFPTSECYYYSLCPSLWHRHSVWHHSLLWQMLFTKSFTLSFFPHNWTTLPSVLCDQMHLHFRWWPVSRSAVCQLPGPWKRRWVILHAPSHPVGWRYANPGHLDAHADYHGADTCSPESPIKEELLSRRKQFFWNVCDPDRNFYHTWTRIYFGCVC